MPAISTSRFSAALCRGLIEASKPCPISARRRSGFPRLYVAASLKRSGRSRAPCLRGPVFRGFMSRPH